MRDPGTSIRMRWAPVMRLASSSSSWSCPTSALQPWRRRWRRRKLWGKRSFAVRHCTLITVLDTTRYTCRVGFSAVSLRQKLQSPVSPFGVCLNYKIPASNSVAMHVWAPDPSLQVSYLIGEACRCSRLGWEQYQNSSFTIPPVTSRMGSFVATKSGPQISLRYHKTIRWYSVYVDSFQDEDVYIWGLSSSPQPTLSCRVCGFLHFPELLSVSCWLDQQPGKFATGPGS